jgi:O-antigen ligase
LLGLIAFLFLLATLLRRTYSIFKSSDEPFDEGLSMGFFAGFIGVMFHSIGANTFIIVRIMEPFWFITAMVMVLPGFREDHSKPQEMQ